MAKKRNMTDFVTCGQMKILEQRADENGLSYYQMMENAGTRAADFIMERFERQWKKERPGILGAEKAAGTAEPPAPAAVAEDNIADSYDAAEDSSKGLVMIFCGKGNNGGDGFVVARLLCRAGYEVIVILVDGVPKTEDSITNFRLLEELPVRIVDMNENDRVLLGLRMAPDIVIDAMYGTGFNGKLRNNALRAAIYINNRFKGTDHVLLMKPAMVVALDIPSGLRGDMTNDKELDPCSVTAHCTITFHARKPVHLQPFAQKHCGEIIVADIGIDAEKLWGAEIW